MIIRIRKSIRKKKDAPTWRGNEEGKIFPFEERFFFVQNVRIHSVSPSCEILDDAPATGNRLLCVHSQPCAKMKAAFTETVE